MSTFLVVMTLASRQWVPQYVIRYQDEAACQVAAAKYPDNWRSTRKATCVPEVLISR